MEDAAADPMAVQMFGSLTLLDAIGLFGALLYLTSYVAVQTRKLDGNSLQFTAANTVAALFVLIGLFQNFNIAAAIIQITWVAIGGYRLFNYSFGKRAEISQKT